MTDCRCYVRHLSALERMTVRYGAHALECPTYRPSGDPVDAAADIKFRELTRRVRGLA